MDQSTLDPKSIVEDYINVWNVPLDQRVASADSAFAADGYYCDGVAEASGSVAIAAMIDATYEQFPGAAIELISPVDAHHQQARFEWRLCSSDGAAIVDGIDVIRWDEAGRLTEVLGFFGTTVPSGSRSTETFRWERTYQVSSDRLFALMSDNALFGSMAPNVESIDGPEQLEVGAERVCHDSAGASWTETYTDWVEGERFSTRVDIDTYPSELRSMVGALDANWSVRAEDGDQSTAVIELIVDLTEAGLQVFRDGGGADGIFVPLLDACGNHLAVDEG